MEDFYETRISEVDGQMVAFFGVFDGTAQVFITYLWDGLFVECLLSAETFTAGCTLFFLLDLLPS